MLVSVDDKKSAQKESHAEWRKASEIGMLVLLTGVGLGRSASSFANIKLMQSFSCHLEHLSLKRSLPGKECLLIRAAAVTPSTSRKCPYLHVTQVQQRRIQYRLLVHPESG